MDQVDRFCAPLKTYWMLTAILKFNEYAQAAMAAGITRTEVLADPLVQQIARMKSWGNETAVAQAQELEQAIQHKQMDLPT